ncbi:hypothetical protein [Azospirillum doebereinerae]|uniref:Uncharacterized protein n=1 Tax=Azospirillum doebereinerae TaxID=92933 RepID=A0A433J7F6_9PROT|nr:hypothetical protein [Azospirillum doebereinerae]MCG5241841.1 hypothetical protein [Azospirillum doebereinerae]RUQ69363.1 hypothetical protein EJ913_16495 [Azospirillum doebereinerae]
MPQIIEIPVTLRVVIADPVDGTPSGAEAAAIAALAAEHFTHVSHAQIAAFNEVNRVHPQGKGVVEAVTSVVHTADRAA